MGARDAIITALLMLMFLTPAVAQFPYTRPFKTLSVSDGLPQSFVSSIVQDSTGFIWIATRDGLARYDGKKFKIFIHKAGDTTTLASNTISGLYLDRDNRLWIMYETGDLDILNTRTEILFHFSKQLLYRSVYGVIKSGHSITQDALGNIWLLGTNGGIFVYNPKDQTLRFFSERDLGLNNNTIVGISEHSGNIALVADTSLVILNPNRQIVKNIPYKFNRPHLYYPDLAWKDDHPVFRKNGEIVIQDFDRLIIYRPQDDSFKVVEMPEKNSKMNFNITLDDNGQVFIIYAYNVYILCPDNSLTLWKPESADIQYGFKSFLIDRSGVLWLGGNGSGIQLHDLRSSGLSGKKYVKNFHTDIFEDYLHVSEKEFSKSFLSGMSPYFFRWVQDKDRTWLSKGSSTISEKLELCYLDNGHLMQPAWHYTDTLRNNHANISALATSASGKLWGIDFYLRPVSLDTSTYTAKVFPEIAWVNTTYTYTVSGFVIQGEDDFWITTALDGLFHYNKATGATIHYMAADNEGALPTNQLMNIVQDPYRPDVLWIGSLGGGLISFNTRTGKCHSLTISDGLPNNTVYAVTLDANNLLWCSSNKGIFSFNLTDHTVSSFTSKDGLPCDEFNRYHFFKFPDGRLAFGGINGYTVFDPPDILTDAFQPAVALTGISINNVPVDYGDIHSLFKQSINSLDKIDLPYHQNFISFEMAALQYNITEKLQYRYMLQGFDPDWVYAGNNNIAAYTNIPPGKYTLQVNATNTAGKWSTHIKTITVVIHPPFWQTPWFVLLVIAIVCAIVYIFIKARIKAVRKEEQQKLTFEREASELKAQALRAQMNPHFIFNCLNSIKALIQGDNKQRAIIYLTTFSKLIRNQLNNAQQEISLHAELETCRLYVQLEALRFGDNIAIEFNIEEGTDLFSLQVPPLILQPFIENAIWHGILPKNGGTVSVNVMQKNGKMVCTVEDDGIGREMAIRNKSQTSSTYESKGMKLVQNRLTLYNTISHHGGSVRVIDKKDRNGQATGTLIIITFNQEL